MNQQATTIQAQASAETGIWAFILADMCIFALYFFIFAWDKSVHPEQFAQGQATLNITFGGANTIILLISSCFMAKAVQAARLSDVARYTHYIRLTILCGCLFLVIKAVEYSDKLAEGYHVASNEFYRDYFAFTGLHMLHVIIGLLVLGYALQFRKDKQAFSTHTLFIENTGLYWHMVDLLWVVLFTFIYLVP